MTSVTLDPDDPFESLLISIIETERGKRADYATEGDMVVNLRRTSKMLALDGYTPFEDALAMVARKYGRIVNLRGRAPSNESMVDSIDDLITYALFAKYLALEDNDGK